MYLLLGERLLQRSHALLQVFFCGFGRLFGSRAEMFQVLCGRGKSGRVKILGSPDTDFAGRLELCFDRPPPFARGRYKN
jgi:hypothetical protein